MVKLLLLKVESLRIAQKSCVGLYFYFDIMPSSECGARVVTQQVLVPQFVAHDGKGLANLLR